MNAQARRRNRKAAVVEARSTTLYMTGPIQTLICSSTVHTSKQLAAMVLSLGLGRPMADSRGKIDFELLMQSKSPRLTKCNVSDKTYLQKRTCVKDDVYGSLVVKSVHAETQLGF